MTTAREALANAVEAMRLVDQRRRSDLERINFCNICGGYDEVPHEPGCALDAAIRAAEAVLATPERDEAAEERGVTNGDLQDL